MDIAKLKQLVETHVLSRLDHRNLNLDVPWFRDRTPSAENIAVVCWEELSRVLPKGLSLRIRLWETPRNYVEYQGS
jgi:6-pyruvoyltetrahydropterin/6-carboxytetrahydropterin synthase